MKSIGLEITPSGIAVVQLSADRVGYNILNGNFFPLNPLDRDNWEIDLLQALKEIRGLYNLDNATLCVSLSQSSASCRNITFPFSRRSDVMKSLPFELEEELPMDSDDGSFDAKTVSLNANETSVLAFAVRSEEIQKLLDVLERVQIDPDIITVEGAAFANLHENWSSGSFLESAPENIPSGLHLRFFFRKESTLVSVFRGKQMIFVRSIPWGEQNLIHEIMAQYNYPFEQAESIIPQHMKYIISLSGASADDIKISSLIEKTMRPFFHELRLMLIELQDRFGSAVEYASITGKIGNIENINALFTKYFAVPCNTERIDGDVFTMHQVEQLIGIVEKMPIAVGAAIEGFKKPRNPAINLRQGLFAKRNLFLEKTWAKWNHAIIFAGILYVGLVAYGFVREQIATSLDDTAYMQLQESANKIAGIPKQKVTIDTVQEYLDEENEKKENIKILEQVQDIEPAMKVVETLSQELPATKTSGYEIRKVDVKFASVTIEGEAKQPHTINSIKRKLEAMSANKKVETTKPTFPVSNGKTAFAFRISIKG